MNIEQQWDYTSPILKLDQSDQRNDEIVRSAKETFYTDNPGVFVTKAMDVLDWDDEADGYNYQFKCNYRPA